MTMNSSAPVSVNGRHYRVPVHPVIVVCIDGCEPAYFEHALAARAMPALARFRQQGVYRLARCVVPTFTNPNNLSIVTGAPPSIHGISGNYFYDPATGQEVMMNDPKFLSCETILAALSRAGCRMAVVTAKDKLRRLLGHGMQGVCFSSEKADQTTKDEHGIERATELVRMPVPSVYSAELSEYVLAAGLELLTRQRPDVMYLSLTDYVQHKHAPGTPAATAFYAMLDRYFDAYDRAGAVLGVTADHGMNGKAQSDGTPKVVYLRPIVDALVGSGRARVILPITDPYVVHHGALGSFATIYLDDATQGPAVAARLVSTPGIAAVYDNEIGCARFELPRERVGDLIVIGDTDTVLGKSAEEHDLSLLEEPLRSHGGVSEQTVPFVINRPLDAAHAARLARHADVRNFDLFDYVLNGAS